MIKVLSAALVGTVIGIGVMVIVIVVAGTATSGASSVAVSSPAGVTVPSTTTPSPGGSSGASTPSSGGASGPAGQEAAQIFQAQGCAGCHTFAPAGSSGQVGPELTAQALQESATKAKQPLDQYVKTSIEDPNAYVVSGFSPGVMPSDFGQKLSSDQIDALVQYLTQSK
jgi:mono/diheme cytochrome c family protein